MARSSVPDREVEKRRLRAAIGRSRRRIDRRVRGSGKAARQLASWTTYARRWPVLTLAGGFGLGWLLAAGLRPRLLVGLFGARFMRDVSKRATELLGSELKAFWTGTAPHADAADPEEDADG
jgi:hypothetical protein